MNFVKQAVVSEAGEPLTVVKTFAQEHDQESSPWNDVGFVAETDRRIAELKSGKVKGYSWDEVKQRARNSIKPKYKYRK